MYTYKYSPFRAEAEVYNEFKRVYFIITHAVPRGGHGKENA